MRCLIPDDRRPELVWKVDLGEDLGVFPHEAANCAIFPVGDALLLCTSNGVDEARVNIPAPRAPSFIALDKRDGRVLWSVVGPSPGVLHGRVFLTMGQDPNLGHGRGAVFALDPKVRADRGEERVIWKNDEVGRSITTPILHDGLLYTADLNGFVWCLDSSDGKTVWTHDLFAPVWSCLLVARNELGSAIRTGAAVSNDTLLRRAPTSRCRFDATTWGRAVTFPTRSSPERSTGPSLPSLGSSRAWTIAGSSSRTIAAERPGSRSRAFGP